jgi:uncharacterized membrane protein YagU involved in acid resistance
MDQMLRFLYNHEDPGVRKREDRARSGVPALEVMAEEVVESFGAHLTDDQRQAGGTILQWVTGIGGGVFYGALRGRLPGVSAGRGLVYGASFSLLFDEGLVPLLEFAPGPLAFPWQTHARGFVAHLVYGAVAEAAMARMGRVTRTGARRGSLRAGA